MVVAVTKIDQPYDVAGLASPDRVTQLLEGVQRLLADANDHVAVAQPRALGGAAGQDVPDTHGVARGAAVAARAEKGAAAAAAASAPRQRRHAAEHGTVAGVELLHYARAEGSLARHVVVV